MNGPTKKPVMLYVEDDDSAVFLLQTALKEATIDIELFCVGDGEQALAWLNKDGGFENAVGPDLILLDLNLPRKNGLDVLAEIHRDPRFRSIPVVVFSSSSLESDKRRSFELGAREYIKKPPTFAAFVDAVRSACALLPQYPAA